MDKQLIAKRFEKAASTYDREAYVQQRIAQQMMHLVKPLFTHPLAKVTEFGCGTGSYSRLLLQELQPAQLWLNDLCPAMQPRLHNILQPHVTFHPGDAEEMAFPQEQQLVTSCSTLQWFQHPHRFFEKCNQSLAEGGILAFSTFGPENFREIKETTGAGLAYPTLEELKRMLSPHYHILHASENIIPHYFASPLEVLRHLKRTGVTATGGTLWTHGRLARFFTEYVQLFGAENGQVPLTYHPVYIVARRKA